MSRQLETITLPEPFILTDAAALAYCTFQHLRKQRKIKNVRHTLPKNPFIFYTEPYREDARIFHGVWNGFDPKTAKYVVDDGIKALQKPAEGKDLHDAIFRRHCTALNEVWNTLHYLPKTLYTALRELFDKHWKIDEREKRIHCCDGIDGSVLGKFYDYLKKRNPDLLPEAVNALDVAFLRLTDKYKNTYRNLRIAADRKRALLECGRTPGMFSKIGSGAWEVAANILRMGATRHELEAVFGHDFKSSLEFGRPWRQGYLQATGPIQKNRVPVRCTCGRTFEAKLSDLRPSPGRAALVACGHCHPPRTLHPYQARERIRTSYKALSDLRVGISSSDALEAILGLPATSRDDVHRHVHGAPYQPGNIVWRSRTENRADTSRLATIIVEDIRTTYRELAEKTGRTEKSLRQQHSRSEERFNQAVLRAFRPAYFEVETGDSEKPSSYDIYI